MHLAKHLWADPREGLYQILSSQALQALRITYRGLRRIEELREVLRRDRILEHFGVLLDIRYFLRDLEDALQLSTGMPVSVIYADMDDFGKINKQCGQAAGDVVMKRYLEVVHESLGSLGTGYRGLGDETVGLLIGQSHERVIELAETIRVGVEALMRPPFLSIRYEFIQTPFG